MKNSARFEDTNVAYSIVLVLQKKRVTVFRQKKALIKLGGRSGHNYYFA